MIAKTTLTLFALFLGLTSLVAQNRNVVQVEVVEENESQKSGWFQNTLIKLNPLLFLRGDIPLYFETGMSKDFAIEAGIGFTNTDYVSFGSDLFSGFDYEAAGFDLKNKLGYSGRIGVRYYASDYGFQSEGFYFGVTFRHQAYNSEVTSTVIGAGFKQELHRTNNDFSMMFGYVNYFDNNAYIEPYVGLGIRSRAIDQLGVYTDPTTGISQFSGVTDVESVPLLSIGFKLGILLAN